MKNERRMAEGNAAGKRSQFIVHHSSFIIHLSALVILGAPVLPFELTVTEPVMKV
jgi:hypothetical protein